MRLQGKVAVLTGASRCIGRAVSLCFAREGALVVLTYQQDHDSANDLIRFIRNAGGEAHAIQLDHGNLDAIRNGFDAIAKITPHIDILVNNAGTAARKPEPLGTVTVEGYDRIFNLNARGLYFTTQEALPRLRDGGRIINVSSGAARLVAPTRSVYAGTKAALEAFTRVWAAELGPRQITVNSVAPGIVETERLKALLSDELRQKFIRETPLARIGQPDDIADSILFLASDEGRWITAQNLLASGGLA